MDIKNKIALITGAAAGIGRATALAFADRGARGLGLMDLDEQGLAETARLVEERGSSTLTGLVDVTLGAAQEKFFADVAQEFGRIDIVFNNAGIVSGPPPFPETPFERVRDVVNINLVGVIYGTQLAIRHMRGSGGGVVINTASTGAVTPLLMDAAYAASKAGVAHFTRSCGELHELENIRVNAICPGVTETAILEKTGGGKRPEWLGPILEMINVFQPEDIAAKVVEMIEDESMAGEVVVLENQPKA